MGTQILPVSFLQRSFNILLILVLCGVIISGCSGSYPVYPGGVEREDKGTPFMRCKNSMDIVVVKPGQEINFEVYQTSDPIEKVVDWYSQQSGVSTGLGSGFSGNTLGEGICPGAMFFAPANCFPSKCKTQIVLVDKICKFVLSSESGTLQPELTDCEEFGGTFITVFHP